MRRRQLFLALVTGVFLVSCNRDPEVAKRKYLENGNRYFDRGKYREASIMYRNAIQKDAKFGEAYYRLAVTEWKLGRLSNSVRPLERAVGLLDKNGSAYKDANLKLAEIYLMAAGQANSISTQNQWLGEVNRISSEFIKRNPNSYEGHKLEGDLALFEAINASKSGANDNAKRQLETAAGEYRRALAVEPKELSPQLSLARTLMYLGKSDDADKLYRSILEQDKGNTTAYSELYQLYARQHRAPDAEELLKRAIINNPKNNEFPRMLAGFYHAVNRPADMVKQLNAIKSRVKENEQAYLIVGDFYLTIGNPEEAIRQYREGIEATPKLKTDSEKRIIEALLRAGKRDEAVQLNAQVLKDNPKDPDARGFAASQLLDSGQIAKALADLQGVVNTAPENFVARFQLGRAYAASGQTEQARQQFTQVLKQMPGYMAARIALAELQLNRHDHEACIQSTNEIFALDRESEPARLIKAAALAEMKRFEESRSLLDAALKRNPNSAQGWFQAGSLNLSMQKYNEAEDAFRKAYGLNPSKIRPLVGIAKSLAARNRLNEAIQILADESKKRPERTDWRMALASFETSGGKPDAAIADLQAALATLDPKDRKTASEVQFQIGEIYRAKGDVKSAIVWLRQAKESQPDNFVILGNLGLLLDAAGQKTEARKLYEESLRHEPDNPVILNNLAFILAQDGMELDQALTLVQRAKQHLPASHEISDTLGWIYLKKNLNTSALQIFRGLVQQQPNNPTFRYHLALALVQEGDRLSARRELQKALETKPAPDETDKIKQLMAKLS
ncbi:MAG: Tetratricopeptide 2 repeat protein [Bryobacterales bacterium]|nr:Tetratricopeptide 2 repeat protein [Bryobacterales bacterium]